MTINPIATAAQRAMEDRALRLAGHPDLQDARVKAAALWRGVIAHDFSAEALSMLDDAVADYAFNYLLKAVNSDAAHPQVLRLFMPPHRWFGRELPGARLGGDNPDNCYRIIPVEAGGSYLIEGHFTGPRPADSTFTLVGNSATSRTLQTIEGHGLTVEPDGRFRISVDDDPANGRPNHLRNGKRGLYLYVRDSMLDWAQETPPHLAVRRLDPVESNPISDAEIIEIAVWSLIGDVPQTYWWQRFAMAREPNTMDAPYRAVTTGGLLTQVSAKGFFCLGEEDALVIRMTTGGARYASLVVHDCYYRTIDYPHCTSTLNLAQLVPDADGAYHYVVSIRDPGVFNWIDTGGLHDLIANHRWQGLPEHGAPDLSVRLVPFSRLREVLPPETCWVSPGDRKAQLAARRAGFERRLIEH